MSEEEDENPFKRGPHYFAFDDGTPFIKWRLTDTGQYSYPSFKEWYVRISHPPKESLILSPYFFRAIAECRNEPKFSDYELENDCHEMFGLAMQKDAFMHEYIVTLHMPDVESTTAPIHHLSNLNQFFHLSDPFTKDPLQKKLAVQAKYETDYYFAEPTVVTLQSASPKVL